MSVAEQIKEAIDTGKVSPEVGAGLQKFYQNYARSAVTAHGNDYTAHDEHFAAYVEQVIKQVAAPYEFDHYHQMLREPFDNHTLGIEFFRTLINEKESHLEGTNNVQRIEQQLAAGDNVFLLSNHQTECDPQLMYLLLEKNHPELSRRIIFVAGHRVTHDPISVPLSLGVNLFCVFSKKHIEHPPEGRSEKLKHNQRTMKKMREMLTEGGVCIYIAPSGGRDRPDSNGAFHPAAFEAPSLEIMLLQGKQVRTPTHYYPLSLWTYPVLPPPDTVRRELGEKRITGYSPVYMTVADELAIDDYPGNNLADKRERRQARANHIHGIVNADYGKMDAMASEARGGSR